MPHAPSDIPDTGAYASRSWSAANKGHAAQVSLFDSLVGDVVDRLRALGLEDDTVVLVTSDNGPHEEGGVNPDQFDANGPLRGYKRNLYEGGVRVPLVAWGPGRVVPGTSDRPTPLTDLLPTLAELGGAPAPSDVDGLSAAPLLTGGGAVAARHDHLYWFRDERGVTSRADAQDRQRATWLAEALRKDRWKAVRFAPVRDHALPDDQWQVELYDLATDIGETSDLAARYPARVAELVALMRASWQDTYPRTAFGAGLTVPSLAVPGQPFTATATLANGAAKPWSSVALTLRAPAGWTVRSTTATAAGQLAPGARLTTTWQVTPPADAPTAAPWTLTAEGTALAPGGPVRYAADGTVTTPPPAPVRDSYLSDLPWISAVNGWGPVERDSSNGKNAAGDGTPIAFGGTGYAKGLGVHAYSDVAFHLGGAAHRFTALVGIDDFSARQSSAGATRATVYGDDRVLLTTPTLTAATGPVPVDVDVRGVRVLRLEVSDANANLLRPHVLGPGPRHGRVAPPGSPSRRSCRRGLRAGVEMAVVAGRLLGEVEEVQRRSRDAAADGPTGCRPGCCRRPVRVRALSSAYSSSSWESGKSTATRPRGHGRPSPRPRTPPPRPRGVPAPPPVPTPPRSPGRRPPRGGARRRRPPTTRPSRRPPRGGTAGPSPRSRRGTPGTGSRRRTAAARRRPGGGPPRPSATAPRGRRPAPRRAPGRPRRPAACAAVRHRPRAPGTAAPPNRPGRGRRSARPGISRAAAPPRPRPRGRAYGPRRSQGADSSSSQFTDPPRTISPAWPPRLSGSASPSHARITSRRSPVPARCSPTRPGPASSSCCTTRTAGAPHATPVSFVSVVTVAPPPRPAPGTPGAFAPPEDLRSGAGAGALGAPCVITSE
ncbi:hypothetical protein STANM309S_00801 [Streptomyces tanashiensis]